MTRHQASRLSISMAWPLHKRISAAPPQITGADARVVEGNSDTTNLVFNLTLSWPSPQLVTVQYRTVDGSARFPADYVPITNSIARFLPGQTSAIVTVQVVGEAVVEMDETFL